MPCQFDILQPGPARGKSDAIRMRRREFISLLGGVDGGLAARGAAQPATRPSWASFTMSQRPHLDWRTFAGSECRHRSDVTDRGQRSLECRTGVPN